ncbi:hypothetical protein ACTXPD_10250 [Vreelandella alkaliphila]|uniref:hypothetical protein n=1 Tax=Vreelandella alkaliphila TaxID=272774 RepID=UPI003FD7D89E
MKQPSVNQPRLYRPRRAWLPLPSPPQRRVRHAPGFSGEISDELKIINKVIRLLTPG